MGTAIFCACDFVIKNFNRMLGGEIFVPKIPSIFITDLAKSMDKNKNVSEPYNTPLKRDIDVNE